MRGKHWTGSSIFRIRHSISEHDRMENWGTVTCSRDKKYFFTQAKALGLFQEKLQHMFSHRNPQLPFKKHKRHVSVPVLSFRQIAYLDLSVTSQ